MQLLTCPSGTFLTNSSDALRNWSTGETWLKSIKNRKATSTVPGQVIKAKNTQLNVARENRYKKANTVRQESPVDAVIIIESLKIGFKSSGYIEEAFCQVILGHETVGQRVILS